MTRQQIENVVENAIEIAFETIDDLMVLLDVGEFMSTRQYAIKDYIIPWAFEAEKAYRKKEREIGRENMAYYDFISDFADEKVDMLREHARKWR